MRLIDADALKAEFLGNFGEEVWHYTGVRAVIDVAPTIDAEPVRHGHWIFHTFDEVMNGDWLVLSDWRGNGFECSNCGRLVAENNMAYKFKYCPNCGGKMS